MASEDTTEDGIQERVAKTRAQLENTLDAIEDKFNVPKRVSGLAQRAQSSFEENRTPWIVGATAVGITIVGLVAWAIFSGDDD